jgi:hypothetical protein
MLKPWRIPSVALVLVLSVGCEDPDRNVTLEKGRRIATLVPSMQAKIYRAAAATAFDLRDSALVLLVHARYQPRTTDNPDGEPVPKNVVSALRDEGLVRGACDPVAVQARKTPRCATTEGLGYIVRVSDIFVYPGDTMVTYIEYQIYDTPTITAPDAIHFKNAYKLVQRGDSWVAVKEGRVKLP